MVCSINSLEVYGIGARSVRVEVDIHQGLPAVHIVGLANKAVQEARIRVIAALKNSGFKIPMQKIVVNLAPADEPKSGTCLDLAIAIGILIASRQLVPKDFDLTGYIFWGELSLTGATVVGRGALPVAIAGKEQGIAGLVLPEFNAEEAGIVSGIQIVPVKTLAGLVDMLAGKSPLINHELVISSHKGCGAELKEYIDLNTIYGQAVAKRALEIAAAGGHNILLSGPPGVGKTMLCQALAGILPPLEYNEALEVSRIYSAAGVNPVNTVAGLQTIRPFRAPHHTATVAALLGGGARMKPGELSLAHHGVLFFDECNQFDASVLEALREPLQDKVVRVSRFYGSYTFPADFIFAAALNPCPCGNHDCPGKHCTCTAADIQRFRSRLPQPILNRIDLQLQLSAENEVVLTDSGRAEESSQKVAARIGAAREIQIKRGKLNGVLSLRELERFAPLAAELADFFNTAVHSLELSPREQLKVWRVARTIADLEGCVNLSRGHLAEAVSYRLPKDISNNGNS